MAFTPPYQSRRDTIVEFLQNHAELHALGLAQEDSVFQADTATSPSVRPFIVVRMGEVEVRMELSSVQGADLWVYDDFGDYNRAALIAQRALELMAAEMIQIPTTSGRISQISDRGVGADLADDGFDALVIPAHFGVVGRGA